jgi:drug/metabolite transporter (DMT)-like permease
VTSLGRREDVAGAAGWMVLSGLAFTLMSVLVRRLSGQIPEALLIFSRGAINFTVILGLMLIRREPLWVPGKPLLIFRGLMGTGGVTCLFYAIAHLPLPIAAMLNWCSPLFVVLFSRLFTAERLGGRALLGLGVALFGLSMALRPDLAFSGAPEGLPWLPVAVGLLGAAFGGAAYVAVRAATARVSAHAIILYFTATATVLSAPFAYRAGFRVPLTLASLAGWELLGVGLFATVGQSAMTQAYRLAPAGIVSTLSLMNAVFSLGFGAWLFGERLSPGQLAGMAVVGIGIVTVVRSPRLPLPTGLG